MAIYSGFSNWTWWFSIAMLVHQRVPFFIIDFFGSLGCCSAWLREPKPSRRLVARWQKAATAQIWRNCFRLSCDRRSLFRASKIWRYGCVWKCCVPLNPLVLLIIIPMKNGYFIGNIPYFQTNPYVAWGSMGPGDGEFWRLMLVLWCMVDILMVMKISYPLVN